MAMLFMNSMELEKYFLDTGLDANKTLFVVVSDTLENNNEDPKVININEFMPNANMISLFEDAQKDAYRTQFVRYLQLAPINATLAVLLKYCIDDEKHVVMVCSVNESQYKYFEVIADYLELVYNFKAYHVKDYIKAMKKGKVVNNNHSDTLGKISTQIAAMKAKDPNVESIVDAIINGRRDNKKKDKKKDKDKKSKKKDKKKKKK